MSNLKYNVILQLTVFVWGYTGILGKLITLEQEQLVWFRTLIAFCALLPMLFFFKRKTPLQTKHFTALLFTGSIIAGHWVFFYGAIKVSTVSIAVVCLATQSVFVSLLQPLFAQGKIILYEFILGLIAIFGIVLIFGIETEHSLGIVFGLAASLLGGIFTLINSKFVQHSSPMRISTIEMLGGFIFLSIYLIFSNGFHANWFSISSSDWLYLLLLSVFCTAITFPVSVYVMRKLTPFTISISLNLEPIYTILLALLIFGDNEHMSTGFYFGALIIFTTVIANAFIKYRLRKKIIA